MLRSLAFIPVVAIAVTFPAVAQQKVDFPKEGKYDVTNCWSGVANTINFSKTYSAVSYELTGASRSNPSGGYGDMSTFRCVGFTGTIDGKVSGMNMCEVVDQDGDKRLNRNVYEGPKQTSGALIGTGKYEGIVAAGTSDSLGAFPEVKPGTFQGCNHSTGTYKMKSEATGSSMPSRPRR